MRRVIGTGVDGKETHIASTLRLSASNLLRNAASSSRFRSRTCIC